MQATSALQCLSTSPNYHFHDGKRSSFEWLWTMSFWELKRWNHNNNAHSGWYYCRFSSIIPQIMAIVVGRFFSFLNLSLFPPSRVSFEAKITALILNWWRWPLSLEIYFCYKYRSHVVLFLGFFRFAIAYWFLLWISFANHIISHHFVHFACANARTHHFS